MILEIIKKMQGEIKDLQEEEESEPTLIPISDEQIEEILSNIPDEDLDTLYNTVNEIYNSDQPTGE